MYIDALRYSDYDRLRHGRKFKKWLAVQAARLAVTSQAVYNALLAGYSSKQVESFVGTPPVNTVAPVASGTPVVGQTLTVTNGTWTGTSPSFTHQWYRGGSQIAGATGNAYTLVTADVGSLVRANVVGSNPAGSASAQSNTLGPVTAS